MYLTTLLTNAGLSSPSESAPPFHPGCGMEMPSQSDSQYIYPVQPLPLSGGTDHQGYGDDHQSAAPVTDMQGMSDGFKGADQRPGALGYAQNCGLTNVTMDSFAHMGPMQLLRAKSNQYNMLQFPDSDNMPSGEHFYGSSCDSVVHGVQGLQSNLMHNAGTAAQDIFAQTMHQTTASTPQLHTASTLQSSLLNTASFDHTDQAYQATSFDYGVNLGNVQSLKRCSRQCDRCFEHAWDCTPSWMPCPRCKQDGTLCTDYRPRYKKIAQPRRNSVTAPRDKHPQIMDQSVATTSQAPAIGNPLACPPDTFSFSYQGGAIVAPLPSFGAERSSFQSTDLLSRQCDRCYKKRRRCRSQTMPCPRCIEDDVQCTDDRRRPQAYAEEHSSAALMSQLPTSDTPLASRFDLSSVQPLKKLRPPCDRCYDKRLPCQNSRMPCTQCKDDQVLCTDDRPRNGR